MIRIHHIGSRRQYRHRRKKTEWNVPSDGVACQKINTTQQQCQGTGFTQTPRFTSDKSIQIGVMIGLQGFVHANTLCPCCFHIAQRACHGHGIDSLR